MDGAAQALPHQADPDFADTLAMRRFFALLLASALLFQMNWAVAATYCEHETSTKAAAHFGHHVHEHKAADAKKSVDNKFAVDDDCRYCHAGHAALVPMSYAAPATPATAAAAFPQPPLHGSAPGGAPDRPQWLRLA